MTVFIPTTLVNIYRGDTTDAYGDPVNQNTTPIMTSVPCALIESLQRTSNPSSGSEAFVETVTLRFRPTTDVREQDRVRDTRTGYVYFVDTVSKPQSVVGANDVRCSATRVSTGDGTDS